MALLNNLHISLTDPRDQCSYNVIALGKSLWTVENHRYYRGFGVFGLGNSSGKIRDFGGFYARSIVETVCPPGWKIPTVAQWQELYNAWKQKYHDLSFSEFASGDATDGMGSLPMNGIGKLGDSLFDEATFSDEHNAAFFWTNSFDNIGNRMIFSISSDGTKSFASTGNELCNLRFVKSFKEEKI